MIPPKADQHENPIAPIRLGVLVDDDRVPRYVNHLMGELATRPDMELAVVIVHCPLRSQGSSANNAMRPGKHSSLVKLDRFVAGVAVYFIAAIETLMLRLRNRTSRPLRAEPIKHQPASIVRITPLPDEACTQCDYSQADLERLSGFSLDYLVIESEREPARSARNHLAKSGVIRMRFGALPAIPVRQAGFKEVCQRNPTSKFRVMLLHGRGGTPIFEGAFQTGLSLVDNRNELIRKAYPYLGQAIATHFAHSGPAKPEREDSDEPIHAMAMECQLSCRELIGSLWPRLEMIGTGVLNGVLGRKDHWQVSWYRGGWPGVAKAKSNVVESPSGSFLADPFVVNKEGRRICFVEEYKYRNRRGVISALELAGTSARMLGIILDEPFHLSFPFIFEFESRLYMCPESAEAGQIRVYECVDFPMKWKLCKVLMDKVRAADTMLFEHDGRWWMFAAVGAPGGSLSDGPFLFHARSLRGPDRWVRPPRSRREF